MYKKRLPILLMLLISLTLVISACDDDVSDILVENQSELVQDEPLDESDKSDDRPGQSETQSPPAQVEVRGESKVHFIDVGQGAAVLIQSGDANMLIDAGDNQYGNTVVNYLKGNGVSKVDYLIGTHPHADHIGGLDHVINAFEIGRVLMPDVTHTTRTFEDALLAIQNKGLKLTKPKVGATYTLGDSTWTVLAPHSSSYDNLNDYSIVVRLDHGENSFLITGDAESASEAEMVANHGNLSLDVDVLQVSHHGSRSSTSSSFLSTASPSYGVIQVASNNRYGHPHSEVISRLQSAGVEVLRNDLNGNLVFISDGQDLRYEVQKNTEAEANAPPALVETGQEETSQGQYIGNVSSKIFHATSCSSLPNESNRIYFSSKDEAIGAGHRACKRCNP